MLLQIRNACVLTPFSQQDGVVLVEDGKIQDVARSAETSRRVKTVDARGMYLVPGFIDLHVHGTNTRSFMEGTAEAVSAICDAHAYCGTTTLLPTTNNGSTVDVEHVIDAVRAASTLRGPVTIAGVHLQGAFQPVGWTGDVEDAVASTTDMAAWRALLGRWDGIRMVGAAPEAPGMLQLGDLMQARGIVASIANSRSDYEQVQSAVAHGYSDVTDLYIRNSTMLSRGGFRVPGVTECGLAMDELTVQVVADGWQLPLMMLQLIFRCKGAESMILVSDAGGSLTPSSKFDEGFSTMATLVRNMVAAGISLRVALRMATVNPARRIGLEGSKGRVAAGYDADLLLLDAKMNVRFCMAGGKVLRNDLEAEE